MSCSCSYCSPSSEDYNVHAFKSFAVILVRFLEARMGKCVHAICHSGIDTLVSVFEIEGNNLWSLRLFPQTFSPRFETTQVLTSCQFMSIKEATGRSLQNQPVQEHYTQILPSSKKNTFSSQQVKQCRGTQRNGEMPFNGNSNKKQINITKQSVNHD